MKTPIKPRKTKKGKISAKPRPWLYTGPKPRPFYGSYITVCREGMGKKTNMVCPDHKCKYTSRVFIWNTSGDGSGPKSCNESFTCPHHNIPLVNFGCGSKLPKVGSKERKLLIEKYQ